MPTVPTLDNARDNLVAALNDCFASGKETHILVSAKISLVLSVNLSVYLGIHHRLDAETSGCILFATDPAMNVFVAELFRESLIQKEYLAVCNVINPPGARENLGNQKPARARREKTQPLCIHRMARETGAKTGRSRRLFAYSRFEILQTLDKGDIALIKAMPVTGRTHQLRVHLSEYGMPIIGDRTYGGEPADRLMLHARRLNFVAPTAKT